MNKDNYLFNYNYNNNNNLNSNNLNSNNLNSNNFDNTIKPNLVSNNLKNYINLKLKKCNLSKFNISSYYYNIILFALFSLILSIILISKYKGFKSDIEIYKKNIKDKEYIMSKLIYYNRQNLDNQNRIKKNLITDLPILNNNPEASLLHRKIYF